MELIHNRTEEVRDNRLVTIDADFVITGGGMSGVCTAITAARKDSKVVLVQDRPVLGGNASSEVRLWILGATSHMGNNNRWAREGGVIDEILVENLYRNKEGNAIILDTILLEKVTNEPNITLLLNTCVYEVVKKDARTIERVRAFCSQNSTAYELRASLFCDASGDGIVGFLSGAAFRIGAESKHEFSEMLAGEKAMAELLGHSIYFYSKRLSHPVKYVAPSYALKDITKIPKYRRFNQKEYGCWLWWIEYGGTKDTVHDTEEIKWELWRIVYGVWDYIKNSGNFEDVENLTLEWVGTIPGKRESRRFEGLYMLKQQDVTGQKEFEDAVAFGGWALDLHPADGIYSEQPSCTQWHSKGAYQIPLRCFISRDIDNLFFAGRIISATHVAFGSTRVMATCAHGGQAVGMAAALCKEHQILPAQLLEKELLHSLQNALNKTGQGIMGIPFKHNNDLLTAAVVSCSSTLKLSEISFDGDWLPLTEPSAQLLPFEKGKAYQFVVRVKATAETEIIAELRVSINKANYTPDLVIERKEIPIRSGEQDIQLQFENEIPDNQYGFLIFQKNEDVSIQCSKQRFTGITTVYKGQNKAVSNFGLQNPPEGIGIDRFEFWCPKRRPAGQNIAMKICPALELYQSRNLMNGYTRPYIGTNAWVADLNDPFPEIEIKWNDEKSINRVILFFDTDFDHPMESSLLGHKEDVIPFCVRNYTLLDDKDNIIFKKSGNYQTINRIEFDHPVMASSVRIQCEHPSKNIPASLFEIIIE
ncbi:MAG: FAD-dependent oxidoreductase [Chitinophagaceae bacterium]|nr:FAD-dependent oxidoreductase [Chitinophagaceae bacterium]